MDFLEMRVGVDGDFWSIRIKSAIGYSYRGFHVKDSKNLAESVHDSLTAVFAELPGQLAEIIENSGFKNEPRG